MPPTQKKPPGSLYGPLPRRVDHQDPRPDRRSRPAARTDSDAGSGGRLSGGGAAARAFAPRHHRAGRQVARGLPLELILTPGQAGDCPVAAQLLGHLRPDTIVLADKAYDADWLRRQIEAAGAAPNIPPMVHRRRKPCFSPALYRARNRIERFFNRIKHFRRLATRYEKHAANFLAMLKLAATHLWLRHNESVT